MSTSSAPSSLAAEPADANRPIRHDAAAAGVTRRETLINLEIIMIRYFVAAIILVLTAGCNKGGAPEDAQRLAGLLKGDANGATNPICKLFSVREASAYAGVSLDPGTTVVMGTGCQWGTGRGVGAVMITAAPIADADHPSHAPHFRELPELGKGAYVDADNGAYADVAGWSASAPQGKQFVSVMVVGPNASEKTAIALINETLKRRQ